MAYVDTTDLPIVELYPSFKRRKQSRKLRDWYREPTLSVLPATPEDYGLINYLVDYPSPFWGQQAVSGQYISSADPFTTTVIPTTLRAYYEPLCIPYELTIDLLGVYITTIDLTGQARIGIYSIEHGRIYELIYDNIINTNSLGARTVGAWVALSPGVYALAYISDGTAQLKATAAVYSMSPILPYLNPNGVVVNTHWYEDRSTMTLEDEPDVTLSDGNIPWIFARVK